MLFVVVVIVAIYVRIELMASSQITTVRKLAKFYELISTVIFIYSSSTHANEPINKAHINFKDGDWN